MGEYYSPIILAATPFCNVDAAFASGCATTGIFLILCVHDLTFIDLRMIN